MIRGDPEAREFYRLAYRLGTTLAAVHDMPLEELRGWSAYFEWLDGQKGGDPKWRSGI